MAKGRVVRELPCINIVQIDTAEKQLLPVAAYARVSTEKEDQENSFERQVEHYTQIINANPDWRLVEVKRTRASAEPERKNAKTSCA